MIDILAVGANFSGLMLVVLKLDSSDHGLAQYGVDTMPYSKAERRSDRASGGGACEKNHDFPSGCQLSDDF
jgi:hypothetical protein